MVVHLPKRTKTSLITESDQNGPNHQLLHLVGWLFWVKRPFETVFQSISGRLSKRGRKRRERIDESKNVQTTPTRTYCKRSRPLPYCNPNCRTPRHWKLTQYHRTTRPPPPAVAAMHGPHSLVRIGISWLSI